MKSNTQTSTAAKHLTELSLAELGAVTGGRCTGRNRNCGSSKKAN